MRRLIVLLVLFVSGLLQAQWKFIRENDSIQPYILGVRYINNKIVFNGPSIRYDNEGLGYVAFQISELNPDGTVLFDTLHGDSQESYVQYVNTRTKYSGNYSTHIVGRRSQANTGNAILGTYGLVIDTNQNIKIIPAFDNYPEHHSLQHLNFERISDNSYLSITNLFTVSQNPLYPNYTSYLHIRFIDSLGSLQKEKILSIPNRRLFCTTFHQFEGHYYFPVSRAQQHWNASNGAYDISTIMIYKLDTATLDVIEVITEPGLKYHEAGSVVNFQNGDFILACSKTLNTSTDGLEWTRIKVLRKYDKNLSFLWEKEYGSFFDFTRLIKKDDEDNVYSLCNESDFIEHNVAALVKFNSDGDILLWRNYFAVQTLNEYGTETIAYGFDFMHDGGFVLAGTCQIFWPHKIIGWVLRTNCLGFLGPPQAALSHEYLENYQINFYNNSTEAGSFTWLMDDGSVYETTEHDGGIQHTFEDLTVEHTVTLVAHGCSGENDTLVYTIPIHPDFLPEPPIEPEPIIPENGFFAIYPNPAQVGAPINIVMNAQANAEKIVFEFHNGAGQLAASYEVPNQSGVLMFQNEFAQGLYHVSMKVDGKVVAKKKFVVSG